MSHNITKLNSSTPNASGVISQALSDISDVGIITPANGQALGWTAGPAIDAVDLPTPCDVTGSLFIINGGWSGTHTFLVGDPLFWRHPSATVNVNTSKVTFQSGTWISQFTLAAGSYLIKMDMPMNPVATTDYVVARLKDITNNQYLGPKIKIGDGRSSNHLIAYVTPTSSTTYEWVITQVNGGIYLPNASTLQSFQMLFLEV